VEEAKTPDMSTVLSAVKFAADKHREQRRKSAGDVPYINHPIEVAQILATVAGVKETETLVAALLHDTIEDTDTSAGEISSQFGERVLGLVMECTDDKGLPKQERKDLQVQNAPHKSPQAKLIKIADKISNVNDIANAPPTGWSLERCNEYLDWSNRVVDGLRGGCPALDKLYDSRLKDAREKLKQRSQ
jgi:guanosine-3',5'-bis(diphosphate) 3'-pyrophosphohydrolase